jgi:hypothetical protein
MERNFNNEFERFLKDNANQYRVYPSAKVWKGVYSALHTRRKWYGLGMILLLITGGLVTLLVTHSSKDTPLSLARPANAEQSHSSTAATSVHSRLPVQQETVPGGSGVVSTLRRNAPGHNVPGVVSAVSGLTLPELTESPVVKSNNELSNEPANDAVAANSLEVSDELNDQDILSFPLSVQKRSFLTPVIPTSAFNWTIESVLNSFSSSIGRSKRFNLEFDFTPTISYRKLSANRSFLRSANAQSSTASYAPLYDINSAVTHKPDMGLEFGVAAKYALASNFRVRAGLQFNINRYDIKAFNYPFEVAKIALRNGSGMDSVYTLTTHRNFSGYRSDWLQNYYFEISMPIGVEVKLVGDDKVQLGIAGTIQPTYVLGERAYLLSTDYKNYAEVPWLIRRWNASTSFETYVAYSTGKMKWQVGPQVRYQLLSSFVDKYPVKENLFDFGLKVGISLNK